MRASLFGRLATPIKPILDNLYLETFWFFVPNRLVWRNWERFNGAQDNPDDSTDYLVPSFPNNTANPATTLLDYMGIPRVTGLQVNALPARGYNLIFNEWFRDQNLQTSVPVQTDDASDSLNNYKVLKRGKRHDYFTSALPWPQKGDPVTIDLGGQAPVYGIGGTGNAVASALPVNDGSGPTNYQPHYVGANMALRAGKDGATNIPDVYADLSEATGFTINQLRQSFAIQRLLERDARGGTRYVEVLKSHFGVTSPDARLQRPEFLGGGHTMITVNPVTQNTPGAETETPQGNLAAYGTVGGQSGFTKSFVEHGFIIGLANVRADLTYQQGLQRFWSRKTRFDYYWPALSHLGEMAILNKEIYAQGTAEDDGVFGYQEAYGDYRYRPSQVTGIMRSSASGSLDVWHLALDFANLPVLGSQFIEDNPPMARIEAVPSEPDLLLDCYFKLRCARPMPLYGVPGLIDHF